MDEKGRWVRGGDERGYTLPRCGLVLVGRGGRGSASWLLQVEQALPRTGSHTLG